MNDTNPKMISGGTTTVIYVPTYLKGGDEFSGGSSG